MEGKSHGDSSMSPGLCRACGRSRSRAWKCGVAGHK